MSPFGDIGILTTDRELVVHSWDDWLAAATSIASEAAHGRPLRELAPHVDERRFLARIEETLATGAVQVLSPAFHPAILPCPPRTPSAHFSEMQQRVTIGPLLDGGRIAGLLITIQDVTAQLERERDSAAALASEDPSVRRAAADAMAEAQRIESFAEFSPVLGSEDWRVRGDAVRGLAAAADRDLLRALLATLQRDHRDFSTLSSALKLLAVSDVDVTGPLSELLQDPDADLRIQAALALGEQHQPGAAVPLLRALEDPDPNVRFHAIEALGRLRADSALEALLTIVESRDFFLAFAALEALGMIQDSRVAPRLVPLLEDENLRDAVTHALSQLGDEHAVEPLVLALNRPASAGAAVASALAAITARLVSQGRDELDVATIVRDALSPAGRAHLIAAIATAPPQDTAAIARVLGWLPGADTVQALRQIASRPDTRAAAIDALVQHREAAVDALVEMLGTEDRELRAGAIGALGQLGTRRGTAPLLALLDEYAEETDTVIATCGALARIGDAAAFERLLMIVGHPDPAVRQAAIGALNSIGHREMPPRVTTLLSDENPLVRESAVRIAGYFGYADGLDLVLSCATDPVETVRVAALEHLPFYDDDKVVGVVGAALRSETPRARAAAARALARVESREAFGLLVGALHDEDHWVRYYAARAIGEHRNGIEVPRLAELAETDVSIPVRIAAVDALGVRGDAALAPVLTRCAAGDVSEVAAAALRALGRLGGDEALDSLRAHGRSGEQIRRRAAVEGLGDHGTLEAVEQLEWIAAADGEPAIADLAIEALATIAARDDDAAGAAIDALLALCGVPGRRDAASASLSQLTPEALPRVARGLAHTDPAVRRWTIEVLTRFRLPEATRQLDPALADTDAGVRETAVVAIMRLGSIVHDDVIRELAERDPSKAVRRAAAAALASRRSARWS